MNCRDDHYMPPGESRCCAGKCSSKPKCVRALAPYEQGRPVEDYSKRYMWSAYFCPDFVRVGFWRKAEAKPAREAKEWIG